MFDLPGGYDPEEEERQRKLLGGLLGGITPQEPTAAPSEAPQPMAAMGLVAPDTSFMQQGPEGLGGYKPPPAAKPEFMDRVQSGHEFGVGDVAMLGGILAALLGGGKNGGSIAGALAGSYGQGIMGDMQNRNERNAQIDTYNNKLANQNTELDQWKADQEAQLQHGNLQARNKGLTLEQERERRIAERLALQDDPESELNQGEVTQAERLARARSGVSIEEAQKRSDIELNQRKVLAELLGKGSAKHAAPPGKGGASADPIKALKAREAAAKLAGIDAGTFDPLTGKPIGDDGEKPLTPPQKLAREKYDSLKTPIPGLEIDDEEAWAASVTTPGGREKIQKYWQGVQQTKNALGRMKKLREENGIEVMGEQKAAYDAALTAAIGGFTQIGNSGVLNGGEFARYKDMIPGMAPRLADAGRLIGGEDQTVAELTGVMSEVDSLAADGLAVAGVRPGSGGSKKAGAPGGGSKAKLGDGFSEGAPSSAAGPRTVTVTYTDGETEQVEADAAGIAKLKAHPDVRSVQ